MSATASQIERLSAAYRRTRIAPKEPPLDQRRFVRRSDTTSGMVRIEVQLPPEQAAMVWEALSAALDAGRSQADASAQPDASAETKRPELDPARLPAERADARVSVAQAYLTHSPRTLGSDYELVLMSTKDQLEHGAGGIGSYLRDGTPVPLHVARMLACDCSRVDVDVGQSGEVLDVGRARRTIHPRSDAHCGCVMEAAALLAADAAITCMRITSRSGPMAARLRPSPRPQR